MLHTTLVAVVATLFAPQAPAVKAPPDRTTYEAVRKKAGQDPRPWSSWPFWCEVNGLRAERAKHLTEVLAIDPGNVAAQGCSG